MVEAITKRKKKTPPPVNDLSPYTGPWTRTHATHLLRRATFGVKSADVDAFVKKGLTLSMLELFSGADATPAPPINDYAYDFSTTTPTSRIFVDPDVAIGQTWVNKTRSSIAEGARIESFKNWWFDLMLKQKRSLREKMTLFLHNLIATETADVGDGRYAYKHNQLLRTYAFGNYKELIKKVTLDPMMLVYLNGRINRKAAPDENYARELQELFTVGKGPGSGYTENDVKAAAKVLTGYSDVSDTQTYAFNSGNHDTTNKQFSAFYGNKIITGKTGVDGQKELDEMLDMIFGTQEVAKYICRRLYTFFVYYEITPEVEANIITPLANKFRSSGYNLRSTMEALLSSKHFYDEGIMGSIIKSPVDYLIGMIRDLEIVPYEYKDAAVVNSYYGTYTARQYIRGRMNLILQNIGDPPNVAGWAAYYQSPQYHEIWINTDAILNRKSYVDQVINLLGIGQTILRDTAGNNVKDASGNFIYVYKLPFDPIVYISKFKTPSDPNLLVDELVQRLLPKPVSAEDKLYLKSFLLNNDLKDSYWTEQWNGFIKNPTSTITNNVRNRLTNIVKNLLYSAEYQLS